MFERNRIDNVDNTAVPVELSLDNGDVLAGRLIVGTGRNLFDVLNSAASFLEFEPYGGDKALVAKSSLRNVKIVNIGRKPDLSARARDLDGFDPHTILGVSAGATEEEIKAAWHRLSKIYHPDRYAAAELPEEVGEYLSIMARRVNAAFKALETTARAVKRASIVRATPIYETGVRPSPSRTI